MPPRAAQDQLDFCSWFNQRGFFWGVGGIGGRALSIVEKGFSITGIAPSAHAHKDRTGIAPSSHHVLIKLSSLDPSGALDSSVSATLADKNILEKRDVREPRSPNPDTPLLAEMLAK